MTAPRWVAATIAAAIFLASLVLALVGVPRALSEPGSVLANLGRNLVTTLAVALLAYLWFYFWTSYQATHRLRAKARERPESLFSGSPGKAANVLGRQSLVQEIATSLRHDFRTGPILVVGDTGSGKTSLLLALADHFAKQNVLPVVISLRDVDEIDFFELAHERFKEYIDPYVRTEQDADKLWRWMCRRGDIVVLADDLDRAQAASAADPYKTAVRLALETAARRDLPLVVTSRHEGLPEDLSFPPKTISELELGAEEAADRVLKRVAHRPEAKANVRQAIERGKLMANPFYMGVIVDLLRMRRLDPRKRPADPPPLPPTGDVHAVRVALLGSLVEGLIGGETLAQDERGRRREVLRDVAGFAASRLPPEEESEFVNHASLAPRSLHAAEQLGLLLVDERGSYRFKHEVMHAYVASRVIDGRLDGDGGRALNERADPLLAAATKAPDAPRVQLALIFAAAASREPCLCRRMCESLLDARDPSSDERLLLRATAAAEVASAGEFHDLDEKIARACMASRRAAAPIVRLNAVNRLAHLSGAGAVRALWNFAGDDDYDVRFSAAQEIVTRCRADAGPTHGLSAEAFVSGVYAYDVLSSVIEDSLRRAESLPGAQDDWTPEIVPLKHMAFILPALRTVTAGCPNDVSSRARAHLARLLALEPTVTTQKGLEASIAQGFKADAQLNREAGIDEDAVELLERARFWYSQLNLLQAITVRAAHIKALPANKQRPSELLAKSPHRKPHRYVAATAELCDRGFANVIATGDPSSVNAYIWEDEGKLVSRRPLEYVERSAEAGGLVAEAIQLVGDIVVLLNLNENGDEAERDAFGNRTELPYCMHQSTDRSELFGSCNEERGCTFHLCPYQPAINRLSAHRQISRAFCRHQSFRASAKTARLWGSKVQARHLRESWQELERTALM